MLHTKFRFIWPSGFRGEDLFKSPNQKQELSVVAMFGNGSKQNVHSLERTFRRCFLPSFSSFGWGFSEEKIKMWKVNGWQTTDIKWWQKLILPSYQVSVHLAKRFQRRFLKIGQSETRIAFGGHVCKWIGTKWAIFIEDLP